MSENNTKHAKDTAEQSDLSSHTKVQPDETDHPTGTAQAAENEATESPA